MPLKIFLNILVAKKEKILYDRNSMKTLNVLAFDELRKALKEA